MDQIFSGFSGLLISWGAPGLFIAYLLYSNKDLKDQLKEANQALAASFEKRIAEGREGISIMLSVQTTMATLSEIVRTSLTNRDRS